MNEWENKAAISAATERSIVESLFPVGDFKEARY